MLYKKAEREDYESAKRPSLNKPGKVMKKPVKYPWVIACSRIHKKRNRRKPQPLRQQTATATKRKQYGLC